MVKRKQESGRSPSPKKRFNKNVSLSAIDEVKSPKDRRKSLGNVNISKDVPIKKAVVATPQKSPKKTDATKLKLAKESLKVSAPVKTDASKPKVAKRSSKVAASTPKKTPKKAAAVSDELSSKFRIPKSNLDKAIKASITSLENNPKVSQELFAEAPVPLFLQINAVKIPQIHRKIIRIPLANSILTPDNDVCLIVPDVKGIPNKDHEKHLEHYENLLRSKHVEGIKKIMTFHEFRTEYDTFEMKNKLVELYDCFLADGRIAGKTVRKCGSIFYKKRKVPTSVKLEVSKLKEHLKAALDKVQMQVHSKGDSFTVQFGHSKMPVKSLRENVQYVLKGLAKEFPGGYDNVRSINIKSTRSVSIPIYLTSKNQNEVAVPVSEQKIPKGCTTVQGEISTRLNTEVVVDPFGNVEIKKVDMGEMDEEQQLQNEKRAQKKKLKIKKKFQLTTPVTYCVI